MRAPLSIVIPTLNAASELGPTLTCLMEGVEAGLVRDLVISDGGSSDDTMALAEEWGATCVTGPAGRGGQLARGVEAAQGRWILALHADTHLSEGWSATIWQSLDADTAYYGRLNFRAGGLGGKWVAGWANFRSRAFGLPYGDQSLLISKALYLSVGGYMTIPLMEDVALAQALKGRLKPLDLNVYTRAALYQKDGWVKRGWRNLTILIRYLRGAKPRDLAKLYR
jgi:rSAM/selenodomain-associated transferase 2